jgi:triacylglycerol lipase
MRRGRLGGLVTIAAAAAVLAACAAPPPPPSGDGTTGTHGRHPVVLLDGWQFDCHVASITGWRPWQREAVTRGYGARELAFFSYDACRPNSESEVAFGRFLDAVLARTGADRVDIVSHSMGALVVRDCIRFGTCAGKVDKFLALAPPNHGTIWAGLCRVVFWNPATCDMRPDGPFLRTLNADDETWGDVEYVTMISWCDLTIVPFTSAALQGALNIVSDRCVGHTDWLRDAVAADWAFRWFAGPRRR